MSLGISFTPLAEWLALIMGPLQRAAGTRGNRDHAVVPLVNLLLARLRSLTRRFNALVARLDAGLPAPPRRQRATTRPARAAPDPGVLRLPRGRFWLIRLLPYEAASYGSQLKAMLADPQTAALLAAAPEAGRILRPLCRLLAVHPEGMLALPADRGKPEPRQRQVKPAPVAPPSAMAQMYAAYLARGGLAVEPEPPAHKPPWWSSER